VNPPRPGFPGVPALRLGVATAGFEVEGGFNGPGQPANNWVRWERSGRVEPSGPAARFWGEPERALDRAAGLGCDAFGLSVEWARTEPVPGQVDHGALARYGAILDACRSRGMEPVVTLCHFTHPAWLGEEFWLTPGAPDRFAAHAATVVSCLGDRCRRWVTVHRPLSLALGGWVTGAHPPGRRLALRDALCVVDNLLAAHVLAHRAIRQACPGAAVTMTAGAPAPYELGALATDLLCAPALGVAPADLAAWLRERRRHHARIVPVRGSVADVLCWLASRAAFPRSGRAGCGPGGADRASRPRPWHRPPWALPWPGRVLDVLYGSEGTAASVPPAGPAGSRAPLPLEAIGLSWGDRVAPLPARARRGPSGWPTARLPSWRGATWQVGADPAGLAWWLRAGSSRLAELPQWVVDEGPVLPVRSGRAGAHRSGPARPGRLRAALAAVAEARRGGASVELYLYHSLVDGYAWGTGEARRGLFGLAPDGGWLDTDALGHDTPGAFRRLVAGLRAGDETVLDPSRPG